MNGFFIIDKPAGITSHDVVSRVRRILGTRKVGHTGTLDPFATGVLPVAVNDGTKAIPFLDEAFKTYEAVMRLGVATDTLDMTGTVLSESAFSGISREQVADQLGNFTGNIMQIPPMFSAIKQGGQPLYKLARQGHKVERQSRPVEIKSLEILAFDLPLVVLRVVCSRGTYVRTLADDIGRLLGCGAALQELRRTSSGLFELANAVTLDELESCTRSGSLDEICLSPLQALSHLPVLELTESGLGLVRNGRSPQEDGFVDCNRFASVDGLVCLRYGADLVAVAERLVSACSLRLRLRRVFV